MKKKIEQARKQGFSLIELMIVIVIIGALTAIILPQFNASEAEAKDAGCDASNYGTLRQMVNYRSINGVYPSRLHTGFEVTDGSLAMGDTDGVSDLASVTEQNLTETTCSTTIALTESQQDSLAAAGIDILAYGGFGTNAIFTSVTNAPSVASVTGQWFEDHDADTDEVYINGLPIFAYADSDPQVHFDPSSMSESSDLTDVNGIVVPLFAAPTADWEHAVIDGSKVESKVQVGQVGGCPWLEAGTQFRYYVCFFKVFNNGDPAKLIGTACPECGSLNP